MNNRLVANLALVAAMAVLLVTFRSTWARPISALDQIKLLTDLRYELATEYVDEPDQEKLVQGAINGMIESLDDPYTQYFPPEEFTAFEESVRGEFTGIGAEVSIENNRLQIVTPLEDSPAYKAGVMAGDVVMLIEGEDTLNMDINEAVKRLKGPAGSDVHIRVRHESGNEEDITITRAKIEVKTVRGFGRAVDHGFNFWLNPDEKIGYVRLSQFSERTADELGEVLTELKNQGAKGLVLDLRFNPGGLLDAAVRISDMFLDKGKTIVSVRGRVVPEKVFRSTDDTIMGDIPVVVLANSFSASASEIVTGALSDNERALFVGERTFGKGSVQQIKMLEGGNGAIKITNAYYYLPSGRNIHRRTHQDKWGVDPSENAYIPMNAEARREMIDARRDNDVINDANGGDAPTVTADYLTNDRKDPQLAGALTALQSKIAGNDWPAIGESNADLLVRISEREQLMKQRELLEETLDEIDKKLSDLDNGVIPSDDGEDLSGTVDLTDEAEEAMQDDTAPAEQMQEAEPELVPAP